MKTIVTFSNGKRWKSETDHNQILEYAAIYASTVGVFFYYTIEEDPGTETLISDHWKLTICLN